MMVMMIAITPSVNAFSRSGFTAIQSPLKERCGRADYPPAPPVLTQYAFCCLRACVQEQSDRDQDDDVRHELHHRAVGAGQRRSERNLITEADNRADPRPPQRQTPPAAAQNEKPRAKQAEPHAHAPA